MASASPGTCGTQPSPVGALRITRPSAATNIHTSGSGGVGLKAVLGRSSLGLMHKFTTFEPQQYNT